MPKGHQLLLAPPPPELPPPQLPPLEELLDPEELLLVLRVRRAIE